MMLDHEDQVPMEASHSGLCQFEGDEDPLFKKVLVRIDRAARNMAPEKQIERGTTSFEFRMKKTT
jgi:hypothetical protein